MLAMIAFDVKRLDIAEQLARQAIGQQNNVPVFYQTLGNIQNARGKLDEAVISYKKALSLKPNSPDYLNNLAATLVSLQRYEEAI